MLRSRRVTLHSQVNTIYDPPPLSFLHLFQTIILLGLSVVLGLTAFGIPGAILGPIVFCLPVMAYDNLVE